MARSYLYILHHKNFPQLLSVCYKDDAFNTEPTKFVGLLKVTGVETAKIVIVLVKYEKVSVDKFYISD